MGCGTSTEASAPGGSYDDDEEFSAEAGRAKEGGSKQKNREDKEDDFFEVEEAEGQEFMAVRPWIGQVAEPDNHNEVNHDKPDV